MMCVYEAASVIRPQSANRVRGICQRFASQLRNLTKAPTPTIEGNGDISDVAPIINSATWMVKTSPMLRRRMSTEVFRTTDHYRQQFADFLIATNVPPIESSQS
jgi:hypothetical protein